ncbi:TPA: hypothetical protein ACQ62H_000872 [Neisseria polysaccharea]
MPFGRVGFSPPKQRQTETTAKQRQNKGRRGGGLKPTLRRTQPTRIPPQRVETGKYGGGCSKQREKPDWDDSDGIGGVEVADKVGWASAHRNSGKLQQQQTTAGGAVG